MLYGSRWKEIYHECENFSNAIVTKNNKLFATATFLPHPLAALPGAPHIKQQEEIKHDSGQVAGAQRQAGNDAGGVA
jgi:hypothetical protein